jgi:hypothetical protein
MATLQWKFKDYLDKHSITPYRLGKELGDGASHRLPYDWARERPERLHLPVLERVIAALEELTGESVNIADFLEVVPDPEPDSDPGALAAESQAWLNTALTSPLEPYDWGPKGIPKGHPVAFVPGEGVMVYEDEEA